jgi:uncharacterized membrane protein
MASIIDWNLGWSGRRRIVWEIMDILNLVRMILEIFTMYYLLQAIRKLDRIQER